MVDSRGDGRRSPDVTDNQGRRDRGNDRPSTPRHMTLTPEARAALAHNPSQQRRDEMDRIARQSVTGAPVLLESPSPLRPDVAQQLGGQLVARGEETQDSKGGSSDRTQDEPTEALHQSMNRKTNRIMRAYGQLTDKGLDKDQTEIVDGKMKEAEDLNTEFTNAQGYYAKKVIWKKYGKVESTMQRWAKKQVGYPAEPSEASSNEGLALAEQRIDKLTEPMNSTTDQLDEAFGKVKARGTNKKEKEKLALNLEEQHKLFKVYKESQGYDAKLAILEKYK